MHDWSCGVDFASIVIVHRMVVVGHGMYGDLKAILASASFSFVGR